MIVALTRTASVVVALTFASITSAQKHPRFEDYPVRGKFVGTAATVNLRSHPKARMFRTMLRDGAKAGPNFAGYYTLVMWGCGSDCGMIAIVDCRNGRVYIAPFTVAPAIGLDFRIDSRLLVVNRPDRNERAENEDMLDAYKPSWHVWRNGRFLQLEPKHKRCGTCF